MYIKRRLFCDISPFTYKISVAKCQIMRHIRNLLTRRANKPLSCKYHIKVEDEFFSEENGQVYRNGKIFRHCIDVKTGKLMSRELIKTNHALVMYEVSNIKVIELEKS